MERIKDGLIACIAVKPFAKVSVSDISAASGVTRATFYRIFDTTTDVMSFICDDLFLKASRELRRSEDSDEERIIRLFTFLTENADSIDAIFKSRRADLFQSSLDRYLELYSVDFSRKYPSPDREYYIGAVSAILSSIIFVWIHHGRKERALPYLPELQETLGFEIT